MFLSWDVRRKLRIAENELMFGSKSNEDLFETTDAIEALADLERNTSQVIAAQRTCKRVDIETRVMVQPANCGQRHTERFDGLTADISNGGFMALMARPITVGDFFWVTFDDKELKIGSMLAQCLRCRLVRDDAFEAGFKFPQPIDLTTVTRTTELTL